MTSDSPTGKYPLPKTRRGTRNHRYGRLYDDANHPASRILANEGLPGLDTRRNPPTRSGTSTTTVTSSAHRNRLSTTATKSYAQNLVVTWGAYATAIPAASNKPATARPLSQLRRIILVLPSGSGANTGHRQARAFCDPMNAMVDKADALHSIHFCLE